MVWLIPISWLVMFRNQNRALLLLTTRVHVLGNKCKNSPTSTSETTKTNDNHKHLRRLKDKSSQIDLLTIRLPMRNASVQMNNARHPPSPGIQCWQDGACIGFAKFRPFAQPPTAHPTTGQHWTWGNGVCVRKTTSHKQCSNNWFANFCPSTVPANRV